MTTGENANVTHLRGENAHGSVEPFRWNPETHITYAINVPAGRTGELAEFLASLGVLFDPQLQVFAVNRHPLHVVNFTGEDIPHLVGQINRHLSGRGMHPLIPTNHREWNVRTRHALLTMAAHDFSWTERQTKPPFWDKISPEGWREIAKEYAIVFGNGPG